MPRIYFQHFAYQPENASQFYEAIGRVVILWGRLETVIDTTMLMVLAHPEATFERPKEMPVAFKRKMQLWNKIFKQEAVVWQFEKRALAFSKMAKPVARRRHDVIHAAIGEFSPGKQEGVNAEIMKHKGSRSTLHIFNLVQTELEKLADDIVNLHNIINPIALVCHIRTAAAKRRALQSEQPPAPANKEKPDP